MNKNIFRKFASITALIFSILTIVEGTQVLLGLTQKDYLVFTPLLFYNVIMAIVGLYVSALIWMNNMRSLKNSVIVTALHLLVFIVVISMLISNASVATHSVKAMGIRFAVWLLITIVTWKTSLLTKIYLK